MSFADENAEYYNEARNATMFTGLASSIGVSWDELSSDQQNEFITRFLVSSTLSTARVLECADQHTDHDPQSVVLKTMIHELLHAATDAREYARELEAARMNQHFHQTGTSGDCS
ncbi:hypothetical protein M4D50_01085 [Rothia sp. p3-SID1597]|nr:hypothetical protein [Rothia sp. p3-SID1597]